jgi:sugar lactone lactonase YvrE
LICCKLLIQPFANFQCMKKYLLTLAAALVYSAIGFSQTHQLVKLWETDTLLRVPESVLYDAGRNILYVSNIDGKQTWEKDGAGSIGKVSPDGKIIMAEWVKGLQAPRGMGMYKDRLYVADIDVVAVIDIKQGKLLEQITVEGAQGLNDISIDKKGTVYVSDSRTKKVYQIINGKVSTFLENLKGPNGILAHEDNFYVLDQGSMYQVGKDKTLVLVVDGMEGGIDGIVNVKGNEFLVSVWSGAIWYVSGTGKKELMLDTREQKINSADIGYNAKKRIVYVPTFWKNTLVAYSLK